MSQNTFSWVFTLTAYALYLVAVYFWLRRVARWQISKDKYFFIRLLNDLFVGMLSATVFFFVMIADNDLQKAIYGSHYQGDYSESEYILYMAMFMLWLPVSFGLFIVSLIADFTIGGLIKRKQKI